MTQPKILFFVTEDWYFCSHRLPLALAAKNAGYDVAVVTHVNDHSEVIQQAGIRLIPFKLSRRSMNILSEIGVIIRLIALYRKEKPDLVHHVAMKPVIYGSLAASLAGQPNIINALAGLGYIFTSNELKANILRFLIGVAFKWLFKSKGIRIILQNKDDCNLLINKQIISEDKTRLIRGSGVDINIYSSSPEPSGCPIVILASRMIWAKGIKEFVEAARILKARGVAARFVLVGDTDAHNPSAVPKEELLAWNSEGVIEWWGHKKNMSKIFSDSHIVCLPSFYGEGIPKCLIEAAACGRPIVTTNTPGCREIVKNGENGLLVPIRDSVKLADAIGLLIANKNLRQEMGEKGRKLVESDFSLEIVIKKTLEVYKELLVK